MRVNIILSKDQHGATAQLSMPAIIDGKKTSWNIDYSCFGKSENEALHKLIDQAFPSIDSDSLRKDEK